MFQTFEPASDIGFAAAHVPPLRAALADQGLDGLLIPHDDAYLNEYLPDNAERLMWASGFSGSAGMAIVLKDKAAVFSDGRYTLQLREQVDQEYFELHNTADVDPAVWLAANTAEGAVIGYDPFLYSKAGLAPYVRMASKSGFTLKALETNPIDAAWEDQPEEPCAPILPHPDSFSGEGSASKRHRLADDLKSAKVGAALLTAPHSLAWLFNIRGGDVHASPLPLGRAILRADGSAELFIHPDKVTDGLPSHLGNEVTIRAETEVMSALADLGKAGVKVAVDPAITPLAFTQALEAAGAGIEEMADPCSLPRALKNDAELNGARTAHIRDGAVITRFLHWLAEEAPKGELTEIAAAQKLESLRIATGVLKDISFDTISGSANHGALPHYRVSTRSDQKIKPGTLFLIDSGGQYEDGTTDITRTMAIGTPTEEMRRCYTLVLQGHIALATAKFPKGTSGHALDAFARRPLWEAGLDYDHGTGHGVGSYLGVHEGPQKISKHPIAQALEPGMICSNEPGFYKAGEFGIRIENLIIVNQPQPVPGGEREMMSFETITLAPLERELIDADMLTAEERKWVDDYHAEVWAKVGPELDGEVKDWLKARTAAL
ncbi:M24 family metallopeptidase [Parvularcula marina]|uniref:M24 family metallopeptidase n=1 Tax=Parvularcula marina TaxID=2292771 RepID=UPI003510D6F9